MHIIDNPCGASYQYHYMYHIYSSGITVPESRGWRMYLLRRYIVQVLQVTDFWQWKLDYKTQFKTKTTSIWCLSFHLGFYTSFSLIYFNQRRFFRHEVAIVSYFSSLPLPKWEGCETGRKWLMYILIHEFFGPQFFIFLLFTVLKCVKVLIL